MSGTRPSLEGYPGWSPAKEPVHRRRWVQVLTVGMVTFLLGMGVGGASTASPEKHPSPAAAKVTITQADVDAAVDQAVDQAVGEAVDKAVAKEQRAARRDVAAVRSSMQKRIDGAQARARTQLSNLRAQMTRQKNQAVASAVARTRQQVRSQMVASAPSTTSTAPSGGGGGTDPRFSYCYEANDAGYGPYYQGTDPEYGWYDDADNDGIVCEP
jgi:Skp family chaperone for outer membrane proteins